jgi:phosphoribosyl 1,2-cyclic phosphodiesterase
VLSIKLEVVPRQDGILVSLKISVLGSGSSGNSTFIGSAQTRILIDGGLSRLQTLKRLIAIGETIEHIDAFIISHEHTDHIRGLPNILAQNDIPVYMAEGVAQVIEPLFKINKVETIQAGHPFNIGDIQIAPFSIPHDAVDPLGYTAEIEGHWIAYATDLGYLPELVVQRLKGCSVMVLESNHDLDMLKVGSYPWHVKQRIMSRHGHLSNDMASKFLREEFDGLAQHIILAHLSRQNNHPDIARMVASQALETRGFNLEHLWLADQDSPTKVIEM